VSVSYDDGALLAALRRLQEEAPAAAKAAASAMATSGERAIKLQLSKSAHSRGTPTPSSPGTPPSLITGRLRQSARRTRSLGTATRWEIHVAPTTVYARIQELGGDAGRGHRSHLPPRPYIRPALLMNMDEFRRVAIAAFHDHMWA
jgi:phage gpG-like protein